MSEAVVELRRIVARLRGPGGCPWDQEQTHGSLKPGLIEECYEVVDAIDAGDDANLREELGDLLLQVVFHAQLSEERAAFDLDAVAREIGEKLVRRHPHVFGDEAGNIADAAEVLVRWEELKRAEKGERTSAIDGVPNSLPGLMRAQKVQKKAARVGFDWPEATEVLARIDDELREARDAIESGAPDQVREEVGDLLFTVVNLSRKLGFDSEETMNGATAKFSRRFRAVEAAVRASGRGVEDCRLEELDAAWDLVKRTEG
ncbi:MAG: nucleoside triphosphate pyrophosphohydrolase [Chthoniobacterales bacterium]